MNFETLVKVGIATLSLGVATYTCVKAYRKLKAAEAETARIIEEGKAAAVEMEQQTAAMEAQQAEAEAQHEVTMSEIQAETDRREVKFQEQMNELEEQERIETELFDQAFADPQKIDQLVQHFERGNKHDRQRKGSRRAADLRRGKRNDASE